MTRQVCKAFHLAASHLIFWIQGWSDLSWSEISKYTLGVVLTDDTDLEVTMKEDCKMDILPYGYNIVWINIYYLGAYFA